MRPASCTALLRGSNPMPELTGNKRAAAITSEDVMISAAGICRCSSASRFRRTDTRTDWPPRKAMRIVEQAIRDPFDHWLAGQPAGSDQASSIWVIARATSGYADARKRKSNRKSAVRKLRLPGKLADCTQKCGRRHGTLHRRGRFGGRLCQAGA